MNILFLACCYIEPSMGGTQRVTDTLAKELINKGHSVFFLSVQWGEMVPGLKISAPQYYVDVEHTNDWKSKIQKIFDDNKIEYIINQMPGQLTNLVLRELSFQVKVVTVFHTQPFLDDNVTRKQIFRSRTYNIKQKCFKWVSFFFPKIRKFIFSKYEKQRILDALKVSDKICFISERFYPRILKHIPNIPKDKLAAINNPNAFNPINNSKNKENILLWVGRIENGVKNTIDFVKIWERLFKINPSWKAIVAGDGDDLQRIKKYVKLHAIKNLEFIGRCDNVESLYQRAKFIVVTSFSESWSMVLTEGMAYGCVPCAYNTYETVNDIINAKSGIITNPTPVSMAVQLNEIMCNDTMYEEKSKHALESVNKFRASVIAENWINLLSSL